MSAAMFPPKFSFGLTTRKAIYQPYNEYYPQVPAIDWEKCTRCGECLEFSKNSDINLDEEPIEFDIIAGAVVVATGFRPYEPFPGEFGFGETPNVITLPQLERILAEDGPTGCKLEIDGHPINSLALIHCVDSCQIDGLHKPQPDGNINDYCSRVCCTATLSGANHIHERFPEVTIYDVYEDIRTGGSIMTKKESKEEAKKRAEMLTELRKQHSERVKTAQEMLKEQKAIRKTLMRAIRGEPHSVPQLAEDSDLPADEVLWHIASMKKYGEVAEVEMDEKYEYYQYVLDKEANQ
jgi:heterodisulfide reductase subunit A-like polyferredoxin